MKNRYLFLALTIVVAALVVPCEAKTFFSRITQLKEKIVRETKRSGNKLKEFITGKKEGKQQSKEKDPSLRVALLKEEQEREAGSEGASVFASAQQLEKLIEQREALRFVNSEQYIKKLTENIQNPKDVVGELINYITDMPGSQEKSLSQEVILQIRQEQQKLKVITTEIEKLLDDVKKYDKNNKEMIVRLHHEKYKTEMLNSKFNILVTLFDEALGVGL